MQEKHTDGAIMLLFLTLLAMTFDNFWSTCKSAQVADVDMLYCVGKHGSQGLHTC